MMVISLIIFLTNFSLYELSFSNKVRADNRNYIKEIFSELSIDNEDQKYLFF